MPTFTPTEEQRLFARCIFLADQEPEAIRYQRYVPVGGNEPLAGAMRFLESIGAYKRKVDVNVCYVPVSMAGLSFHKRLAIQAALGGPAS